METVLYALLLSILTLIFVVIGIPIIGYTAMAAREILRTAIVWLSQPY
jgi:hypothetical protein